MNKKPAGLTPAGFLLECGLEGIGLTADYAWAALRKVTASPTVVIF